MHPVQFPKILAFIEGTMERLFVNSNFGYVHVVKLDNGESWTIESLCRQIQTNYRVISYLPDYIIIWFDKENLPQSVEEISLSVTEALTNVGVDEKILAICIPNKMTENIILADEMVIRSEFGYSEYTYPGDGINGKNVIKEFYKRQGKKYRETFHGPVLLKKVRLSRSALKSHPVSRFIEKLPIDCWWF